ncbi:MAG TPA: glycerophosphodiester phosphodiesterase [Phenylobacterium sp.]|uniref:glycerophosphodiester phosphodiesterase n=1 Tax=Phenylobacterium sp. TaxID=1871053 RepID=UPI002BAE51EB|nr:glycerophosphodiester phosphodiesterase [Phenylobacterium sp.]HSV04789.1 glycerophosphodiester phosphodiesterase [Phenylobacterium sp.]
MDLTRRTLSAALPALAASRARAAPKRKRPLAIAHRGASGERPEHTLMGYRLAIAEGADFIEPDLVPTRDGHLVVRHEPEIGGTTDVAKHPEFASRKTTKVIDGEKLTGWFTHDFTLQELKTLRARERLPQLRPSSARFDGLEAIPTYQEMLDLAKAESRRVGRPIGTYPEMKHPTYFASIGLPLEHRLLDALRRNGLDSRTAPVFVQCFEVGALKTFRTLSKAPLIQLVQTTGGPADAPNLSYREMTGAAGLRQVAAYADGIGPEWPMVVPVIDGSLGPATPLVAEAHAKGLAVHPWTVRAENAFLPAKLRRGASPAEHGDVDALYSALYATGIDGLFSDFTALNVAARDRYLAAWKR